MMIKVKSLFIIVLFLLPAICTAQKNTPVITMQMQNGKIFFDNTYALNASLKKEDLFSKALGWFNNSFPYPEKAMDTSGIKKGELAGTGVFKINTSASGHYYWIKFTLNIIVRNDTYEIKAFGFYEKPIEPGISNEYSKIEYRWWDYRQGKPWSVEDTALFGGLSRDINDMMVSLEKDMSK